MHSRINLNNKKIFLIIILIIAFSTGSAAATEPIMITISSDMHKIIFDGKWTFYTEWKRSSLNTLTYNDSALIQLRTAHQDNFIYVFVDAVSLTQFDKSRDMAVICFDKNNAKTTIPNDNDYCFLSTLDGKDPVTLQGGSSLALTNNFKKIPNPDGFIGIGNISDENDRYTPNPHSGYEFKIPTDVVGRSDIYGFYLGVYDSHSNKIYSWPQDITSDIPLKIPSPSKWGEIESPDKTLPEFPWPFLSLLFAILPIVYLTRKKSLFKQM
jgi:hypothetical protein